MSGEEERWRCRAVQRWREERDGVRLMIAASQTLERILTRFIVSQLLEAMVW